MAREELSSRLHVHGRNLVGISFAIIAATLLGAELPEKFQIFGTNLDITNPPALPWLAFLIWGWFFYRFTTLALQETNLRSNFWYSVAEHLLDYPAQERYGLSEAFSKPKFHPRLRKRLEHGGDQIPESVKMEFKPAGFIAHFDGQRGIVTVHYRYRPTGGMGARDIMRIATGSMDFDFPALFVVDEIFPEGVPRGLLLRILSKMLFERSFLSEVLGPWVVGFLGLCFIAPTLGRSIVDFFCS